MGCYTIWPSFGILGQDKKELINTLCKGMAGYHSKKLEGIFQKKLERGLKSKKSQSKWF